MTEPVEQLPDILREVEDPLVTALVEHIDHLTKELQIERELRAYWCERAEKADARVGELETERFAR